MAVAFHREPMAPALHADHLTDVLHGLNVRHWNYLDLEALAKLQIALEVERFAYGAPWDNFVSQECWLVSVYDDGLDCGYFDDYPGDHVASHHRTKKGAESNAAYLEHAGIAAHRIQVYFGSTSEIDYNIPMRD